jgi:hypothetical protein
MRSERIATITARNDRPFSPKHATIPKAASAAPAEQRSDHAREIELNRVERNRVRHIFLVDERGQQRLMRGTAERLGQAGDHRQRQDVPDANDVPVDQRGERERRRHLDVLRRQQETTTILAVGDDAAEQREQQNGQLAEERVETKEEG